MVYEDEKLTPFLSQEEELDELPEEEIEEEEEMEEEESFE